MQLSYFVVLCSFFFCGVINAFEFELQCSVFLSMAFLFFLCAAQCFLFCRVLNVFVFVFLSYCSGVQCISEGGSRSGNYPSECKLGYRSARMTLRMMTRRMVVVMKNNDAVLHWLD